MIHDIKETLITNDEIIKRAKELAEEINVDYADRIPILVGLMKGSIPFMAELLKNVRVHCQTEYIGVSSYLGTTSSSGQIKILKDLDVPIKGRDIIIVEDIVDSGLTLDTVSKLLLHRGAKSVEIVCMLSKKVKRKCIVDVKYVGFEIEDKFVVGFGLDYEELYRNLPFIGVLKEEVYQ